MPNEQARRLLFLFFPTDVAESVYRLFGDIVAAARAQLSVELLRRQAAAMDAWHRNGVASQLREIGVPVLLATGTEDLVIPASNALKLANAIPGAWLAQFSHRGHAFMAQYPRALADLINGDCRLDTRLICSDLRTCPTLRSHLFWDCCENPFGKAFGKDGPCSAQ